MKVGLYLGATALCDLEETQPVSGDQVPRWNKTITFETLVQDLPLSGRLCMGVVGVSKRKKKEVSKLKQRIFKGTVESANFTRGVLLIHASVHDSRPHVVIFY